MRRLRLILIWSSVAFCLVVSITWLVKTFHRSRADVVGLFLPRSSIPPSMRLIDHGSERSIFGDGTAVIVFTVKSAEFTALVDSCGYSAKAIDNDSALWRLKVYNDYIAYLTKQSIRLTPEFASFVKDSRTNRQQAWLYYDETRQMAIGICHFGPKSKLR